VPQSPPLRDISQAILMSIDFTCAYELGASRKQEGRPKVWETREVRKEMNHVGPSPFTYFLFCILTSEMLQDIRNPLMHLKIYATMPMFTLASMLALLPRTQPLLSIHVLASTDTHSCTSSAGILCNDVVGVPHHQLPQTNTTIHSSGQCKDKRRVGGGL